MSEQYDTAVVGAGAFGGWTALWLRRLGQRVLLVDAWGAGNSRSSSGGETRVLRRVYGRDTLYSQLVIESLDLWKEAEREWHVRLFHRTGVLWMCSSGDGYVRDAMDHGQTPGVPVEELTLEAAGVRYPQIAFDGIGSVYFEQEAGYLLANEACKRVWNSVVTSGGNVTTLAAHPGSSESNRLLNLRLSDGSLIEANTFVFATGPWLPTQFPELLGPVLKPTRQEVFYFGTPEGDDRFSISKLPVWVELGPLIMYGVPDCTGRGFKAGDDTRGPVLDPTTADRTPRADALDAVRSYVTRRFPLMADTPLVESRVCQYTNTLDGHLIVDLLPTAENVWIVGGGSGHGFKLGPVIGRDVARRIVEGDSPDPAFRMDRLKGLAGNSTQFQHVSR